MIAKIKKQIKHYEELIKTLTPNLKDPGANKTKTDLVYQAGRITEMRSMIAFLKDLIKELEG